ncbi:hypothetical protein MP638_005414 [Amoeboaphelidium occidentale]|nr:hypothetical protein MP638_005414 [Amoeboaphelidium occidentale]
MTTTTTLLIKQQKQLKQQQQQQQQHQKQKQIHSLQQTKETLLNSLSSICYLRGLFKEEDFYNSTLTSASSKQQQQNNLIIKRLSENTTLMQWIQKGVFDALQKGYLKTLVLGIFKDLKKPNDLIESYTFHFNYKCSQEEEEEEVVTMTLMNSSTTEREITSQKNILRTILLLIQTLDDLPEERYLTLKLHYYEDRTPVDYEPEYFQQSDYDESLFYFSNDPVKFKLGSMESHGHSIEVRLFSVQQREMKEERCLSEEVTIGDYSNIRKSAVVSLKIQKSKLYQLFHQYSSSSTTTTTTTTNMKDEEDCKPFRLVSLKIQKSKLSQLFHQNSSSSSSTTTTTTTNMKDEEDCKPFRCICRSNRNLLSKKKTSTITAAATSVVRKCCKCQKYSHSVCSFLVEDFTTTANANNMEQQQFECVYCKFTSRKNSQKFKDCKKELQQLALIKQIVAVILERGYRNLFVLVRESQKDRKTCLFVLEELKRMNILPKSEQEDGKERLYIKEESVEFLYSRKAIEDIIAASSVKSSEKKEVTENPNNNTSINVESMSVPSLDQLLELQEQKMKKRIMLQCEDTQETLPLTPMNTQQQQQQQQSLNKKRKVSLIEKFIKV